MSDYQYLEAVSGESGGLAAMGRSSAQLCDVTTKGLDALFGPDEIDTHDASCNTCSHFVRKPMTPEEKRERNTFGMPGKCKVKLVQVKGWQRGIYCGFENAACYENRRTGKSPDEAMRDGGRS